MVSFYENKVTSEYFENAQPLRHALQKSFSALEYRFPDLARKSSLLT